MKKNHFLLAGAITMLFALNSCKTETEVLDLDKTLKFTKLTVEEQKQSIEQNGIALVDKMDGMQDTKAMIALQAFITNANGSQEFVKPFSQLRANLLKNDGKALETFEQQMRVVAVSGDENWGIWTWNFMTNDFDYTPGTKNTATYLFPATENATTNTGELKMIYVESTVVAPDTDPVMYMPTSISVVLKVSGAVALKADFAGTYNADATPTKITQTLEIDKYNWNFEFKNDAKDASASYGFNYDKEVLFNFAVGVAGTLTADALQAIEGPQGVFTSGAVNLQVMNIAILGGFKDFKAFADEMDVIDGQKDNDKTRADKQVAAINKYLKMYGYFVKENQKFADVEFYVVEKTDTYQNYVWNNSTQNYELVNVTETYYDFQPRLVLSDGSKQDMENFMKTGFEDLISKLESYNQ